MLFMRNMMKTAVIEELIGLAAARSGLQVEIREANLSANFIAHRHYYHDTELLVDEYLLDHFSLWCEKDPPAILAYGFWTEFDRLTERVTKPLSEPVLGDDQTITPGSSYVVDGVVRMYTGEQEQTVREWKATGLPNGDPILEIRHLDEVGRALREPVSGSTTKSSLGKRDTERRPLSPNRKRGSHQAVSKRKMATSATS